MWRLLLVILFVFAMICTAQIQVTLWAIKKRQKEIRCEP